MADRFDAWAEFEMAGEQFCNAFLAFETYAARPGDLDGDNDPMLVLNLRQASHRPHDAFEKYEQAFEDCGGDDMKTAVERKQWKI